ncbi:MAG: hypothetical protein QOG80_2690, partial [Pseudonocardiales bacterium]|nr:hypothetical protein [Pseudonocardiales bacterium]
TARISLPVPSTAKVTLNNLPVTGVADPDVAGRTLFIVTSPQTVTLQTVG